MPIIFLYSHTKWWNLFSLLIVPFLLPAQNFLMQSFNPNYKEVLALTTDSMFIRYRSITGNHQDRAMGIVYDEKDRLARIREYQTFPDSKRGPSRTIRTFEYVTDGHTETEEVRDETSKKVDRTQRLVKQRKDGQPETWLTQRWDSTRWVNMQRMTWQYDAKDQLSVRLSEQWEKGQWQRQETFTYQYDPQGNLAKSLYEVQQEKGFLPMHERRYRYDKKRVASETLYALTNEKLAPLDSIVYTEGASDSTLVYGWHPVNRSWFLRSATVLADPEQKKSKAGKIFTAGRGNTSLEPRDETIIAAGLGKYTDEAAEEVTRRFDKLKNQWKDVRRKKVDYREAGVGGVYGKLALEAFQSDSAGWQEQLTVEGWFRLKKAGPREAAPVASCKVPNPYARQQTIVFTDPDSGPGPRELRVMSAEGRVVFQQVLSGYDAVQLPATLQPGFYVLSVIGADRPVCIQKLIVE